MIDGTYEALRLRGSGTPDGYQTGTDLEYTVTRCGTCGQPNVVPDACVCGHSVVLHDLRGDVRTRCLTGLTGCGCKRYEEAR